MAETTWAYGRPKGSANDASSVWSSNMQDFASGSVTDAYTDGGWFGSGTSYDGSGGLAGSSQPPMAQQASNVWNQEIGGLGGLASGIGSFVNGISGLADMWFKYDTLKAQKNSART